MTVSATDHRHMSRALELAKGGIYTTDPNPSVGCVIVASSGETVGEGFHRRAGELHAEPLAIAAAGERARGATAYVTLEPCNHHGRTPPCAETLIAAGVTRVVAATEDPNPTVSCRGYEKLRAAGIEVDAGVLEAEAIALNRGYTQRMRCGRPWVRVKIATSIDGRTALANGVSKWITGPEARADVHRWRARSSAILTGSGTILADDPAMNARPAGLTDDEFVQPLRVVVDTRLSIRPEAKLMQVDSPLLIMHSVGESDAQQALAARGANIEQLAAGKGGVDLASLMQRLGGMAINDLWVEAGARLNGNLLEAGLIDELIVYQAPAVLGGDGQAMFGNTGMSDMQQRYNFSLQEVRQIGADLRLHYRLPEQD